MPAAEAVHVYRSILERVQARLAGRGHYAGAPSGEIDAETRMALLAFQREQGPEATGLPDQPTLATLPEAAAP